MGAAAYNYRSQCLIGFGGPFLRLLRSRNTSGLSAAAKFGEIGLVINSPAMANELSTSEKRGIDQVRAAGQLPTSHVTCPSRSASTKARLFGTGRFELHVLPPSVLIAFLWLPRHSLKSHPPPMHACVDGRTTVSVRAPGPDWRGHLRHCVQGQEVGRAGKAACGHGQ